MRYWPALFGVWAAIPPQAQEPGPPVSLDSGAVVRLHWVDGREKVRLLAPIEPGSPLIQYCRYPSPACGESTINPPRSRPVRDLTRVDIRRGSQTLRGAFIGAGVATVLTIVKWRVVGDIGEPTEPVADLPFLGVLVGVGWAPSLALARIGGWVVGQFGRLVENEASADRVGRFARDGSWHQLDGAIEDRALVCRSVGWLVLDGERAKVVTPHLNEQEPGVPLQGSEIMTIPARAVLRIVGLTEDGS